MEWTFIEFPQWRHEIYPYKDPRLPRSSPACFLQNILDKYQPRSTPKSRNSEDARMIKSYVGCIAESNFFSIYDEKC